MRSFIQECLTTGGGSANIHRIISERSGISRGALGDRAVSLDAPPVLSNPPGQQWSPRNASQMIERMPSVVDSSFFNLVTRNIFPGRPNPERKALSVQLRLTEILRDQDFMTIFADSAFMDMMFAAAQSAGECSLLSEDLPSPSGAVFFERSFPLEEGDDDPIRAVAWGPHEGGIIVFALGENPMITLQGGILTPVEYDHDLFVATPVNMSPDGSLTFSLDMNERKKTVVRLVRSISAIAQSSHTKDETVSVESKKQRKHRERKGKPAPRPVRVLSLHNPEYGRYELDAATGRKLRQHWVRGHWRNQWYPKLERNKRIWVDGFVRGDAELGTVTGPKVYVARGKKTSDEDNHD